MLAGYTDFAGSHDFLTVRLNQDGSLDGSFFDSGGGTFISFGSNKQDEANALVLQPDGRIVTAGFSNDGVTSDFTLLRQNPDGTLDGSFGFGGGLLTSFGPGSISETRGLVLQPDGKLVEAGTALAEGDIDFALVRHNSDGSLDLRFRWGYSYPPESRKRGFYLRAGGTDRRQSGGGRYLHHPQRPESPWYLQLRRGAI